MAFDGQDLQQVGGKRFMSQAWRALVFVFWLSWGTGHAVEVQTATDADGASSPAPVRFDIGPQPLSSAVKAFSDVTGESLLVDERLLVGRVSPGVRGVFTAEDALKRLLAGSGLRERYASDRAFTLEPQESPRREVPSGAQMPAAEAADPVAESYAASLQDALENALCRVDGAQPGSYRLALQLWIDGGGEVAKVRLLGSTGQPPRDAAIQAALGALRLDPPPAGIEQPLTLLLLPAGAARRAHCGTPAAARG